MKRAPFVSLLVALGACGSMDREAEFFAPDPQYATYNPEAPYDPYLEEAFEICNPYRLGNAFVGYEDEDD